MAEPKIEALFCVLLPVVISFLIDLYDIFSNGLSTNNNLNKVFMIIIIFLASIIFLYEGYKKYNKITHFIPIFGLTLNFFSFIDLLFLSILDILKSDFNFFKIIQPIGYFIIPLYIILLLVSSIINDE